MKNKQEIDCIFRKVRSFKKYVKCKRRDRVKAKMKPCITAHLTLSRFCFRSENGLFSASQQIVSISARAVFFLILVFLLVVLATLILCQGAKK